MRIRNLNTFLTVVRLGSFHAAAQQLHASQPAISARIAALEDDLGVKLFNRDKSGTRLTPRGTQLIPYAEKLLAVHHEMRAQLQNDTPQKGTLRIGVVDTLAHLWLADLLQAWREQHPLLAFELRTETTDVLIQQLGAAELDLALMVADDTPLPDFVCEPLCQYDQYWLANPDLIGEQSVQSLEALTPYPVLCFPRQTRPWRYLQRLFAPLGELKPVIHTCGSVASLLKLVEQRVGVALLPAPLAQEGLDNGSLIQLEQLPQPPALNFCCAWRLDDDRILPRLLADTARKIVSEQQQITEE